MDNETYDAVEATNTAVATLQAETKQAGEQSFAAAKDFAEHWRAMFEKGLHETRARYVKNKGAMDEASAALQTSLSAAREGVAEFNARAIEAIKADAQANFDLLSAVATAKTLPDVVKLNTEFVRKRFEDATARAKSFSEFARKVADDSAAPLRDQMAKTFKFAS